MSAADLSRALPGGGRVLFTTRADGNMSSVSGELAHEGAHMRERLRTRIGASRIARARQVHGGQVRRLRSAEQAADTAPLGLEADGHAAACRRAGRSGARRTVSLTRSRVAAVKSSSSSSSRAWPSPVESSRAASSSTARSPSGGSNRSAA